MGRRRRLLSWSGSSEGGLEGIRDGCGLVSLVEREVAAKTRVRWVQGTTRGKYDKRHPAKNTNDNSSSLLPPRRPRRLLPKHPIPLPKLLDPHHDVLVMPRRRSHLSKQVLLVLHLHLLVLRKRGRAGEGSFCHLGGEEAEGGFDGSGAVKGRGGREDGCCEALDGREVGGAEVEGL